MIKAFFILILIYIVTVLIFTFILKRKNKDIEKQNDEIDLILSDKQEVEIKLATIMGELEIERIQNDKLAKKLAVISCMSLDDVLHELQDDKDNNKG